MAREVYPRASGGTRSKPSDMVSARGLSPRERGNRYGLDHSKHGGGSIPARAGEPP